MDESDHQMELGTLTPPAYFGEIGLLEHRPRTATVVAVTECVVYRIDGHTFVDALTTETMSPSARGRLQTRLARTHPSLTPSFGREQPR